MAFDPELPGCFDGHLVFAASEPERDQAFAWLAELRSKGAVWAEVEAQIDAYLRERAPGVFFVIEQVDRAWRMLGT